MSEKSPNLGFLNDMKTQLESYGKMLHKFATLLDVDTDDKDEEPAPKGSKEKAVGTAEVIKAHEATDNDPED